jgi:hypothetical protein
MRAEFGYLGAATRWRDKQRNQSKIKERGGKIAKAISKKNSLSHSDSDGKRWLPHNIPNGKRCVTKLKETKLKETKDIITPECNFAYETWINQTSLIKPRFIPPTAQKRYDKCVERLGNGEQAHQTILLAIKNYGTIIADPKKYYFSYKWTFEEFLTRDKSTLMFGIPTEDCLRNFKRDKKFNQPDPPMERKASRCLDCHQIVPDGDVICKRCNNLRQIADKKRFDEEERLLKLSPVEIQNEITLSIKGDSK